MVPYSNSTHFEHTAFATRTFFTPRRNVCWRSYSEFDQSEDDDVGETHVGGVLSLGEILERCWLERCLLERCLLKRCEGKGSFDTQHICCWSTELDRTLFPNLCPFPSAPTRSVACKGIIPSWPEGIEATS